MNEWLVAGAAMLVLLAPCGYIAMRGSTVDRLLGLELGAVVTSMAMLLLAEGFDRSIYFDLAVVYTALSGMNAATTMVDVSADNLANAETPGFKAGTVQFGTLTPETLSFGSPVVAGGRI